METDTEAAVARFDADAAGRTQVRAGTEPGTAPKDTVGAFAWPTRIDNKANRMSTMPIRRPFSYMAVHIKKALRVSFV